MGCALPPSDRGRPLFPAPRHRRRAARAPSRERGVPLDQLIFIKHGEAQTRGAGPGKLVRRRRWAGCRSRRLRREERHVFAHSSRARRRHALDEDLDPDEEAAGGSAERPQDVRGVVKRAEQCLAAASGIAAASRPNARPRRRSPRRARRSAR